jgi:hypothetical protein
VNAISQPASLEAPRPGPIARLAAHARRSLPSLSVTLAGTTGWVLVTALNALLVAWLRGWQTPEKFAAVGSLFAVGAALAFPLALFAARFVSWGRSAEAAFAAMFLSLSVSTLAITAFAFGLVYRAYYATWHEDFGTIVWVFQFTFTIGAAVIQFAVLGVRMLFPLGFVALFAISFWFARTRSSRPLMGD